MMSTSMCNDESTSASASASKDSFSLSIIQLDKLVQQLSSTTASTASTASKEESAALVVNENDDVAMTTSMLTNQLHRIRQEAWKVAYKHIYDRDEIDEYFSGRSSERRTWPSSVVDDCDGCADCDDCTDCTSTSTSTSCNVQEIYVCCINMMSINDQENKNDRDRAHDHGHVPTSTSTSTSTNNIIVGYAKWCFSPKKRIGELQSLYILPKYWNIGCGSMLWDCIMKRCREEHVRRLDTWVLDRAQSKYFYMSKGCSCTCSTSTSPFDTDIGIAIAIDVNSKSRGVHVDHNDNDNDNATSRNSNVNTDSADRTNHYTFGDYFIGQHKEKAVCYVMNFQT